MVSVSSPRGRVVGALAGAALALACSRTEAPSDGLVLRGFQLVDAESEAVTSADVVIEAGKVSAVVPAGTATLPEGKRFAEVDGGGRWLLPAFWDLKVSPWGNPSTKNWRELFHMLWITDCLRVQLYYGVAHVVASDTSRNWMERELKRAKALELDAAEVIYPDLPLCQTKDPETCAVVDLATLPAFLDGLKQQGVELLQAHFGDPNEHIQPVSPEVLEAALRGAAQRGMRTYVFIDQWQQAQKAVELGARALQGLPKDALSDELIATLERQSVAFAPALGGWLELPRLLGQREALEDPFLVDTVQREVLDSYLDVDGLWEGWKPVATAEHRERALSDVGRLARAGVELVTASGAGWSAGAFQGYTVHASQVWLERAGVEPWKRLRALAASPAHYLGRRSGLRVGDPADFVGLAADPLSHAAALRQITLLVREGHVVDRAALKPDVSRPQWRQSNL